ncbi:MAG: hypothetical protein ITG02_13660 [Patulibacter sp.]|nr:hypothetical protein [Patulibacter sp.]
MSVRPVNPHWLVVSVACLILMVIAVVLLADWLATAFAMLGAVLTGYQAYAPRNDKPDRDDDEDEPGPPGRRS